MDDLRARARAVTFAVTSASARERGYRERNCNAQEMKLGDFRFLTATHLHSRISIQMLLARATNENCTIEDVPSASMDDSMDNLQKAVSVS